jgi:uncharacterized membrane protein YhaH (DUF805 family)
MLGAVFGFSGRVNRLQFFFGSLGLGFGLMALLMPMAMVFALHGSAAFSAGLGLTLLFGMIAVFAAFWISLSLQARRIRDIGWNPLIVIPGSIALQVADLLVARAIPHLAVSRGDSGTGFGVLLNLGLCLCLLFWPGGDGASTPTIAAPKAPKPPRSDPRPEAPVVASRPAPAWNLEGPRTSFGRRGL